jgi:hypothetical protein
LKEKSIGCRKLISSVVIADSLSISRKYPFLSGKRANIIPFICINYMYKRAISPCAKLDSLAGWHTRIQAIFLEWVWMKGPNGGVEWIFYSLIQNRFSSILPIWKREIEFILNQAKGRPWASGRVQLRLVSTKDVLDLLHGERVKLNDLRLGPECGWHNG